MNIVFWALVILALVLIWFCLSFAFKKIGGIGLKLFNDARDEILSDEKEKQEKGKSVSER